MTQQESLSELLGIQHELQRNTDLINEQVKSAGRLGAQFVEARKSTESLNAALRFASNIQADLNKSFFTSLQVKKAADNLVKEQQRLEAKQSVFKDALSAADQQRVAIYKQQLDLQKQANAEIETQQDILNTVGLTRQDYANAQARIGHATRVEARTQKAIEASLKNKNVAAMAMYDISVETVKEAVRINDQLLASSKWYQNLNGKAADLANRLGKSDFAKGMLSGLGFSGGVAGIFSSLVKLAFAFDNSLTSISKKSGTTAEFSKVIGDNYINSVHHVKMLNTDLSKSLLTVTSMLKAQDELQTASGQMALFTEKSVQDQVFLTKQMGMQADEAAGLNKLGLLGNKTAAEALDITYNQVAASNKNNGLRISGLEVAKAVAKVEGVIAANYKNNTKELASAVVQAKALGISLEQAAAASNSLLDFESSISNELEVELLTGKRWNLEKARSLALDGKSAEAMAEMLKNMGGLQEFEKMNVITKQAAAKAVGMTADELANSLRTSELMKNVSKETVEAIKQSGNASKYNAQLNAATNAAEMLAAEKRVSTQMKFESSMEKVREALGQMASGPLLGLVDLTQTLTENAGLFKGVLVAAAAMMATIATSSMITALGFTVATGGANWIGATAGVAGLAAAGLTFGAMRDRPVNDGLISPSGQILISTPEGMIKPNKNDSIITTTNPGALLSGGGSGKTDQLLASILSAVQQPGKVYLGATEVGTTLGISYSAYA